MLHAGGLLTDITNRTITISKRTVSNDLQGCARVLAHVFRSDSFEVYPSWLTGVCACGRYTTMLCSLCTTMGNLSVGPVAQCVQL